MGRPVMSKSWTFHSAGQLVFGSGMVADIGELTKRHGFKKVLVVEPEHTDTHTNPPPSASAAMMMLLLPSMIMGFTRTVDLVCPRPRERLPQSLGFGTHET